MIMSLRGGKMKNLIVYFSWPNNARNLIESVNKEFKIKRVQTVGSRFCFSAKYNCTRKNCKNRTQTVEDKEC